MKKIIPLLLLSVVLHSASALAGVISVTVQEKVGRETAKKSITQERSLSIKLTSNSQAPLDSLKVKYHFLVRDLESKDVSVAKSGEKAAALPKYASSVAIETEKVTSDYSEKTKKADAKGKKFIGYAVQVFNGSVLVGEAYSGPDMKAKVPAQ